MYGRRHDVEFKPKILSPSSQPAKTPLVGLLFPILAVHLGSFRLFLLLLTSRSTSRRQEQ